MDVLGFWEDSGDAKSGGHPVTGCCPVSVFVIRRSPRPKTIDIRGKTATIKSRSRMPWVSDSKVSRHVYRLAILTSSLHTQVI